MSGVDEDERDTTPPPTSHDAIPPPESTEEETLVSCPRCDACPICNGAGAVSVARRNLYLIAQQAKR